MTRRWITHVALLILSASLTPSVARAAANTAIVATGDCRSETLNRLSEAVAGRLAEKQPWAFISPGELAARLRPDPPKTTEALSEDIEAARALFYESDYLRARTHVEETLKQALALPPGTARWKVTRDAWLLHGLILRAEQPNGSAYESSFRQVLRIDPKDTLDARTFSPNTRLGYERVRKALARSAKIPVEVRSRVPGADIFLDGFRIGKTPALLALVPGDYPLGVGRGADAVSFPRELKVISKAQVVDVDVDLEGEIRVKPVPCLARKSPGDELASAVETARRAGLEKLVLLQLEPRTEGFGWLTAMHINGLTGQHVREGGIKLPAQPTSEQELDDLIAFVLTGELRRNVVGADPGSTPPWQLTEDLRGKKTRRALRFGAYGAAAGAVLAGGSALGVYLSARSTQRALKGRLSPEGFAVEGDAEAQRLAAQVRTKQSVSLGLVLASGVAAAASATLWYLSRPTFAKRLTVTAEAAPNLDGGGISLQGAF